MMTKPWSRRDFLRFMGRTMGATALACPGVTFPATGYASANTCIRPIAPSTDDEVVLADGLEYEVLVSWSDPINSSGERFGFNNDYTAFFPIDGNQYDGLLWVNHEEVLSAYFSSPSEPHRKSRDDIDREVLEVGGSIIRISRQDGHWRLVQDDRYNRRVNGKTRITIISDQPIAGAREAVGTVGNCAGGVTPWQTVLTCEENFHFFYGDVSFDSGQRIHEKDSLIGWERYLDHPPEHYGWVVEVDPFTGAAKKLTPLGRFAHEGATVTRAPDGRPIVYMGDDETGEHIYKFVAAEPGSLAHGTLYVAMTDQGRWLPLDLTRDKRLQEAFRTQTELLVRTREAAKLVGATPQDRPEDIEIDPQSGAVLISLTKHPDRPYGSILKLVEKDNDPSAQEFVATTFLAGGLKNGFACPDNLAFDPQGNLWVCTDISSYVLYQPPYDSFKNNGLFYIPMSGRHAGIPVQVASAPPGAELTGPTFSPDGRTLFLSVQHPGEDSAGTGALNSHWPDGGDALPRPSVICISGPLLDQLTAV